jgi:hypothetical protein
MEPGGTEDIHRLLGDLGTGGPRHDSVSSPFVGRIIRSVADHIRASEFDRSTKDQK